MPFNWVMRFRIRRYGFRPPRPMMRPTIRSGVIISWCGMRGIVTLAAALALPPEDVFPHRDFIVLSAFVFVMLLISRWVLPEGHPPDKSVSLRLRPILRNYALVLKEPQFITYAISGAFAFSGLLVSVASSPIVFMEVFHVSQQQFGAIFAGL